MAKLFIIGNGFDSAHGMRTKYTDFRESLMKNYSISEEDIDDISSYRVPESYTMPDGEEIFDDKEVLIPLIRCMDDAEGGSYWKYIENSLGELSYGNFMPNPEWYNDEKFSHTYYRNEDCGASLERAFVLVKDYFAKWIETIEISNKRLNDFNNLINPNEDLFLTFNYTATLEKLYNAKNVCHIHGQQGKEIYFGHGNNEFDSKYYESKYPGCVSYLEHLHNNLKKNTIQAFKNNIGFFSKIADNAKEDDFEIYSYGFSFSSVDKIYLDIIFHNMITDNKSFYIQKNEYVSDNDYIEFSKIIKECGFNGIIDSFKINS